MSDHAQLSPSGRHRWGACPGSVRMEAPLPEPPANPAALDGTRTHAMLEEAINAGCLRFPENGYGYTRTDDHGTFTVDKDRIDRLNFAIDYIRSRPNFERAIAETRVYPDGLTARDDLHGTVDVQIPDPLIYEIIDYKDGMAPVEAKDNPQLEQYAIGVLAGLDQAKLPKSIQHTIVQPKLQLKGLSGISTHNVSTKHLMEQVLPLLIVQAARASTEDAPLVPGEAQCKYCKAKATCPALASKTLEGIGMMFQTNEDALTPTVDAVDAVDLAHQAANKNPASMGEHELRQIMDAAPLLEGFIKAVKAEVKARLDRGQAVPGYKLVQGNGSRAWALTPEEMEKKLTQALKVPKTALYKQVLPTPAALKALTWTGKGGEMHSVSAEQYKKVETQWVVYTPGGPVVAPEGDSRPALNNDVSAMFAIPVEAAPVPGLTIGGQQVVMGDVITVPHPSFFNVTPPSFFNVTVK